MFGECGICRDTQNYGKSSYTNIKPYIRVELAYRQTVYTHITYTSASWKCHLEMELLVWVVRLE